MAKNNEKRIKYQWPMAVASSRNESCVISHQPAYGGIPFLSVTGSKA